MAIVFLQNRQNYNQYIGFDLNNYKIIDAPVNKNLECGDYIELQDGRFVGLLNVNIINDNDTRFLFFIGNEIFDFKNSNLSCSVEYIDEKTGNFKLFDRKKKIAQLQYSRTINLDYGGWLVGNYETETEKDIFYSIKEILERNHNYNS